MREQHKYRWRVIVLVIALFLLLCLVVARLFFLNVIDRSFLLQQSNVRIVRKQKIPSYRGMILDRSGVPLAISTPLDSIWVNPRQFHATSEQRKAIADYLGVDLQQMNKRIQSAFISGKEFIYLKRMNSPAVGEKVTQLHVKGVFIQREYKRYYPEAEVTAHVVGLTNVDDHGQEGLELAFDSWLSGKDGLKKVIKDRLGHVIKNVAILKQPSQGENIHLSIDHRIQYLAYRVLKWQVDKYHAASGSVVVLDAKTGEILADVNQPSYNPNDRPKDHDGRFRNRALTDIFEPGSTIKPFTIALALSSGHYVPTSTIDTSPGKMRIGGYTIKDDGLDYGVLTLTQVLKKSSNIGAAKIMLSLPPQDYSHLLRKIGFGQKTLSDFPGEASGLLLDRKHWYPSVVATLAYGYGIAVTTIQLAQGYQVLADHGIKMPLTFLRRNNVVKGERVLSAKVSDEVIKMLTTVVSKGGTGWRARVRGYTVAGKTGTAYIAGPSGYDKHKFIASFVGVAPASDPRLVIAVVVRDPQGQHFGGIVAAPAFSKIMTGALRYMKVKPDDLLAVQKKSTVA
jgi:cell division protein FtsI (penicillin-binding protein 3)